MNRNALFVLALASLSVPGLAAKLTVGPSGSGAMFTEIQPAIDAANPGDRIVVAPGTYAPFVLSKGVHVVGSGSATCLVEVPSGSPEASAIVVSDLPFGFDAYVSGFEVRGVPSACDVSDPCLPTVELRDNVAPVTLHDIAHPATHDGKNGAVAVDTCTRVVFIDVELAADGALVPVLASPDSSPVMRVENSLVWLIGSSVVGGSGTGGVPPVHGQNGQVAIDLDSAALYAARSTVEGGDGGWAEEQPLVLPRLGADGGAAVHGEASVLKLVNGTGGAFVGGDGGLPPTGVNGDGAPALDLEGGSSVVYAQAGLDLDGGVGPFPFVQVPAIALDASSLAFPSALTFPSLGSSVAQVVPGGSFTVDVEGNAGNAFVLFAGFSAWPDVFLAGIDGAFFLNPVPLVTVGGFALDGTGKATAGVSLPPNPNLEGLALLFQGVEIGAPQHAFSGPAAVSVVQ